MISIGRLCYSICGPIKAYLFTNINKMSSCMNCSLHNILKFMLFGLNVTFTTVPLKVPTTHPSSHRPIETTSDQPTGSPTRCLFICFVSWYTVLTRIKFDSWVIVHLVFTDRLQMKMYGGDHQWWSINFAASSFTAFHSCPLAPDQISGDYG